MTSVLMRVNSIKSIAYIVGMRSAILLAEFMASLLF
jgi:hypothetical protein